ncbi:MAG: ABC transporter permease [Flavisolibacter sp.]
MNIIITLRSEILKTKRTAAFYFTLVGAAVVPFIFLLNSLTHGLPDENQSVKDPMNAIFKLAAEMNGLGILPLFVILVCTLLPQIEHKNHTWKQVLTSPQTRFSVFIGKFINIHLMILLFLVANHLFMWLVVCAIHFIIPDLNLLHRPFNGYTVWLKTISTYLTVFGVSAIQFWIGLRFKNFIVSVALGIVLWLTGTVLALEYHSDLMYYFPYSFQIFGLAPEYQSQLGKIEWTSMGYAVFFLVVGFLDFKRRKMNA